jgi:polyisoprenoid-binding protein YceI
MNTNTGKFLLLGLAAMIVGVPARAASQTYTLSDANGKKQITFESKAPVEYMLGIAEGISGTIVMDPTKPDLGLEAMVSVPVSQMQTGNDMRDEHLRSDTWLNAVKYPGIRFELTSTSENKVSKKADGSWLVKADGVFTLKGISRAMVVPVTLKQAGNKLRVSGRFSVHLEDFGVNGPMGIKMIGLKVAPDVQVNVNLVGSADPGWDSLPKKR